MKSREIKFRAWLNHKQQILPDRLFDIDTYQNVIILKENDASYSYSGCYKSCELMQFTGLKDKNVKDIYEGDHNGKLIVFFENGCFKLKNKNNNVLGLLSNYTSIEEFEIIGNIFEDIGLLK